MTEMLVGRYKTDAERYPGHMDQRTSPHPVEQHTPNGEPYGGPTASAPPYPMPWPPYAPPQKRGPAWLMPVAIIVAALLVAGAAVAVALINSKGGSSAADGNRPSASAAVPVNTADSSTCNAWRSTKSALDTAVDPMPADWNWDTPGIDGLIAQSNAIITNAMNLFEPKISNQPADVAAAAHAYVKARRDEVAKLANHTYTEADDVPSTTAYATLNQLCHVG